jgi:MFS family permease
VIVRNRELRRLELAFAGFNSAEWAVWVALLVYAYGRGGTTTVAIVAVVQLLPAALFAPVGAVLGDRHRAGRVLLGSYVAQAFSMAAVAAVLLGGGDAVFVYASAIVSSVAVTVSRPAMSALTPSVARTPDELTATNAASSWVESVSVLVAPALAGVLLAVSGPGLVFAVMAGVMVIAALLVLPVPGPPPAGGYEETVRIALSGAFRVLRDVRAARLLTIVLCADFVALGALDVLYPELAIGVLGLGESWAGYLNAAFGAGATLAVVVTAGLVGRPRLVPAMLAGLSIYLVAFVALAAYPTATTALLLLALGGAGRVVLDVCARTLMQRAVPAHTLSRVFGLLEGVAMLGLAVGSLLVAALVALGGASLALVGIGLLLPLAVAVGGRSFLRIDREADVPVVEIGLLRGLPLFAPLGPVPLEHLARCLVPVEVPAGSDVIRQGEVGDRFYAIADGEIEVVRDGATVATLRRGDGFGEIALLHDVARTATCTAVVPTRLFALEKADFLEAVTGHPQAAAEAERLVSERGAPQPARDVDAPPVDL